MASLRIFTLIMDFPAYASSAIANQAIPYLGLAGGVGAAALQRWKNSKDIKVMKRQVYQNRGELKVKQVANTLTSTAGTLNAIDVTAIAQGDDTGDRDGRRVHVVGWTIRGKTSNRDVSPIVVLSKAGIPPAFSNFTSTINGLLTPAAKAEFQELQYLLPKQNTNHFYFTKRYKRGIQVYYSGSAAATGVRNTIYLCFHNGSTGSGAVEYTINVYYRDS